MTFCNVIRYHFPEKIIFTTYVIALIIQLCNSFTRLYSYQRVKMPSYSIRFALKSSCQMCLLDIKFYLHSARRDEINNQCTTSDLWFIISRNLPCISRIFLRRIFCWTFTAAYFVYKTRKLAEVFMQKVNTRYSVHLTRAMLSLLSRRDRFIRCRIAALSLSRSTYPT